MKRIHLIIVAIFATIYSFGQNAPQGDEVCTADDQTLAASYTPSLATASAPVSFQQASANMAAESAKYEGDYPVDKCRTFHRLKTAGIILTAIGGGLVISGSIIEGAAHNANYEGNITPNNYYAMVNGGGAMVGLGAVGLATGIPLTIAGVIKSHEYCGRYYSTLNLNSSRDGLGLAWNF